MDRTLPHSLEAEKAVLGAVLIDSITLVTAAEILNADDFFRHAHGQIFDAMCALAGDDGCVDLVTLKEELARRGQLDDVGGPAYISSLTDGVPRSTNIEYYARIVKEKATLRRLIQSAEDVLGRAYDANEDAADLIEEASSRFRDLQSTQSAPVPLGHNLSTWLATTPSPITWRIERYQPAGTRAMLNAQGKGGKTTLRDNVVRSLADGDEFLGSAVVTPVTGTVAVFDLEMSDRQLHHWLGDQGIRHPERVHVFPLRGQVGSFDIRDTAVRRRWVDHLRTINAEYVVLDCLRPALDALGLDEHRDVGQFLVPFDALLLEAGVRDALVVHHMGHSGERARGDSRLVDWPDVTWKLVRQDDNPGSARFLSAYGRDVDVPEHRLAYDAPRRRLTIEAGTRADSKHRPALLAVVEVLSQVAGPLSGRAIKDRLANVDHAPGRDAIDAALRHGTQVGTLVTTTGPRNATLYQLRMPVSECPASVRSVSDGQSNRVSECPPPLIGADTPDTDEATS